MAYSDHGYGSPPGRHRVFLQQAQDKLTLRRTVQVCLGSNTRRLPCGAPIFTVWRQQFMKHPGLNTPSSGKSLKPGAHSCRNSLQRREAQVPKSPHRTGHGWLMGAQSYESRISSFQVCVYLYTQEECQNYKKALILTMPVT